MSIYFNIVADPKPNTDSSESTQDNQGGSNTVVFQADVHAGPLPWYCPMIYLVS